MKMPDGIRVSMWNVPFSDVREKTTDKDGKALAEPRYTANVAYNGGTKYVNLTVEVYREVQKYKDWSSPPKLQAVAVYSESTFNGQTFSRLTVVAVTGGGEAAGMLLYKDLAAANDQASQAERQQMDAMERDAQSRLAGVVGGAPAAPRARPVA